MVCGITLVNGLILNCADRTDIWAGTVADKYDYYFCNKNYCTLVWPRWWAGSVSSTWKTRFYGHLHTWSNHVTDHLLLGKSVSRSVILSLCQFGQCRCQCRTRTLGLQLCQAQLFTCLQIFIPTLRMPMSFQDQVRELYCWSNRFYRIWTLVYLYLVALHCRQVSPYAILMILWS